MSITNYTTITIECQDYYCGGAEKDDAGRSIYRFNSRKKVSTVTCPRCEGSVIGHGSKTVKLYDLPDFPGVASIYEIRQHRYECKQCHCTFTEQNPFRCPHFNLTCRCVEWICQLLAYQIQTSTIAKIIGINWNTVRKIQKARMDLILQKRDAERLKESYRPYYLAVDEFAIHKGHSYATCVMDLVRGEVIWVGKGRAIKDFTQFFQHFDGTDYLSQVKAVAMDMNATYNRLVEEYLPDAQIVYDRYHFQAQFGRDVLGQVRLAEAKKHREAAKELVKAQASRADVKKEKQLYTQIKRARWTLLSNADNLSDKKKASLNEILQSHSDLSVCYAMKEEMIELYRITDPEIARERWRKWFDAAEQSYIPALVRFARAKRKRLNGLAAHAAFSINTAKLEGFNNKIKVAKRNSYGFRNNDFFFSFIRFLSLSPCLNYTIL